MKKYAWIIGLAELGAFFAAGFLFGTRAGFKNGQIEYARNHIRWTVMDGIITEFHGLDAEVGK